MVTSEDIIQAYRMILGRFPESEAAINYWRNRQDLGTLRNQLMLSDEFWHAHRLTLGQRFQSILPGSNSEERIDVDISSEQRDQLFALVEKCWEALGDQDPYWSVMSSPEFLNQVIDEVALDRFYASGEHDVKGLFAALGRVGIDAKTLSTVLEYGCGTGRVSLWLGRHFNTVNSFDISGKHLELAQMQTSKREAKNIAFRKVERLSALDQLPKVDLVFSRIVLQHNPPPLIAFMLESLLAALNPGGIGWIQIPSFGLGYSFDVEKYLADAGQIGQRLEMHVLPQRAIFGLIEAADCRLLEVNDDNSTGAPDQYRSTTVLVQKRHVSQE
jgi:SAM-dependent methyltransferase